ncbi:TPA: hypothetical protein DD449_03875 [Candidatus Berkelbacteria bacterium]|uniref:Uncharacterized protein n=1 Tax=Berkelbacteria bacterium GW2011_GWE1_39_12 TaxID=1618337 RepID=A0A0G4B5H3_9BACT|nr:MAG: hypothetical protein UT28_C0001G0411 [Berkelbacteria bacterium GW2011_GWE1_39_12]HBO60795.1 hypothetical protein [Candidatus Berkelbacteria bacterium]
MSKVQDYLPTVSILLLALIMGLCLYNGSESGKKWILPAIAQVQLDKDEEATYKEALVKFAQGDSKLLDQWIDHLRAKKKKGVLPKLPNGYDKDGLIIVDGKAVLIPKDQ